MHNKLAALVVLGKYLGMFDERPQNSNVIYAISDEPMSAEEWKKQYVWADERWRAVGIAELHWHRSHQDAQQAGGPCGPE